MRSHGDGRKTVAVIVRVAGPVTPDLGGPLRKKDRGSFLDNIINYPKYPWILNGTTCAIIGEHVHRHRKGEFSLGFQRVKSQ